MTEQTLPSPPPPARPVTRLAPSPTGALHLGNARTFFATWLLARQRGWAIRLRIEDLDGPRIKPESAGQIIDDLRWLGLDWDGPVVYQSDRMPIYADAVARLRQGRLLYPCVCSRREIELAASAPHAHDGAVVYPGTCRPDYDPSTSPADPPPSPPPPLSPKRHLSPASSDLLAFPALSPAGSPASSSRRPAALRFAVPRGTVVTFDDAFAGRQTFDVFQQLGDFVIVKPDHTPAYQLAVVVDDVAMGVNQVVRGDDLIDSTPRQMLLYDALGQADRTPAYLHLPLVLGTDGRRLAKRHGDTRLSTCRHAGVSAGRLRVLLARWLGMSSDEATSADDYVSRFDLSRVPREAVVLTEADRQELGI